MFTEPGHARLHKKAGSELFVLKPSQLPLAAPYFRMASCVYWEQLGVNRQCWPRNGLKTSW